jgi:hypothetical protein
MASAPISERILKYEDSRPRHISGTVDDAVLRAIEELVPEPLSWTMETGCGKSTILLSNLSLHHQVFTVEDGSGDEGSLAYFRSCPITRLERTHVVLGPTQQTLPTFRFEQPIDLALLDGPHGYPFPELEYYFIYPHLRPGALLVLDDIQIPTIHHLYEFLSEDEMFTVVGVVGTCAIFRRTHARTFNPIGDAWWRQAYNKERHPMPVAAPPSRTEGERGAETGPAGGETLRHQLTRLSEEVAQLRRERDQLASRLAWWQYVAEERRLKRRLERRLGRLATWVLRK